MFFAVNYIDFVFLAPALSRAQENKLILAQKTFPLKLTTSFYHVENGFYKKCQFSSMLKNCTILALVGSF